jgi:hypothetical protein
MVQLAREAPANGMRSATVNEMLDRFRVIRIRRP